MRVDMVPGSSYDLVSSEEMRGHVQSISARMQEFVRAESVGIKPIRFASSRQDVAQNAAYKLTVNNAPQAGYIWSIMYVYLACRNSPGCGYLGRAADPASVPLPSAAFKPDNDSLPFLVDTFNFTSTNSAQALAYGRGQMLVYQGEYLFAVGTGNTLVTGTYQLNGLAIEVPAEMVGKLIV